MSDDATQATGVLVVGHGTADPIGAAETADVAAAVAGLLPDMPVELGFLEVIGPTIADAVTRLAARGCRDVIAAPLLLFAAGHAKRDVPEAVAVGTDPREDVPGRKGAIEDVPGAVAVGADPRDEVPEAVSVGAGPP